MRCPVCQANEIDASSYDEVGMSSCACGHRAYAGYVAEWDWSAARQRWLSERVAAGEPAPDRQALAAYRIWSPAGSGVVSASRPEHAGPASVPAVARSTPPSVQTLLLGLGALLLVVAGAVFAAVVWDRIGAVGQVLLMLGATLGVGALAVRLRHRLPGTAEALAVVAAGLAAVDLLAAPLLGLLPKHWLGDPTLYPAVAFGALGACLLWLFRRFALLAWCWLGWLLLPVASACVVAAVAAITDSDPTWVGAAVAVPALTSLAMLAVAARAGGLGRNRVPMLVWGGWGLAVCGLDTASAATAPQALAGAALATAVVAAASLVWWWFDRRVLVALLSSVLVGGALAFLMALPADPQPVLWAGVVALVGLALGLGVRRAVDGLGTSADLVAIAAACSVWVPWVVVRASAIPVMVGLSVTVAQQVALLGGLVSVFGFVVALWVPATGWLAAVVAVISLAILPADLPAAVEAFSLPFALLLLLAGLLWRRRVDCSSLVWLGPALAVALIPSAAACWGAPWAFGGSLEPVGAHLLRAGLVLGASLAAVLVGARQRLAGLLVPGSVALVVAAGAQLGGGLANLPRWVGLGLAGASLVLAGARIEWLRGQGRRMRVWLGGLR